MRIALVTHSLEGGGAQQVARSWAKALVANGHHVTVVVLDGAAPARVADRPWKAVYWRDQGVHTVLQRIRAIRSLASKVDAFIGVQTYPNLLVLLTGGAQRVISEHNVPTLYLRAGRRSYRAQLFLARLLYRRATSVISVSHAVAADLMTNFHVHPERSVVLMNGILDEPSPQLRSSGPQHLDLLVPARITKQKRPWKAVSVAQELARRGHSVALTWVGDRSWDLTEFEFPDIPGIEVHVLPWRADWRTLAREQTVVLLPSDLEGLGNVLVEAAAVGIPSVASSSSLGVADAIIPGVTGVLASSDDDVSFADAVLEASTLGRFRAPAGWLQQFSGAATSRVFATIFRG